MNKNIKQDYKKKIDELKKHNKFYYENSSPEISDKEYDSLIKENNHLEKKFPDLILQNSPNNTVGGSTSNKFKKINHKVKMLSLANAFEKKDLEEFIERIKKFLNIENNKSNYQFIINKPGVTEPVLS